MTKKKIKEPEFIYALINEDDNQVVGHFKDLDSLGRVLEKNNIDSGRILKISEVTDVQIPPEPDYDFLDRKLSEVLEVS